MVLHGVFVAGAVGEGFWLEAAAEAGREDGGGGV